MTPSPSETTISLRALEGEPLADPMVRRTVEAAARAIAERNAVRLVRLEMEPAGLTATLEASRLAGIGFAAELRRVTTAWWRHRTGEGTLWGEPVTDDEEPEDPFGLFPASPP